MTHLIPDSAKLDQLAQVAVKVGLNLKPGQEVVISAPVDALPLVRLITEHAYKAGAKLVTTFYGDEQTVLSRYRNASSESFDYAAGWLFEGMAKAYKNGAARLAITGGNPFLLANEKLDYVSRAGKAASLASKPAMEPITNFDINWTIVSYPTLAWAKAMFPTDSDEVAFKKLSDAIFFTSRLDYADPVAEWEAHNARLHTRRAWLNDKRFHALRFYGPGTDLTVGLADGHAWMGGSSPARNGVVCNPNIPTEEVFTTPHAHRVDGYVRSTKPLSHQGSLIDGISVRFEKGRIVEAHADKGEEVLKKILESDEGAARLGEVALVPHSSPISHSGLLFFNTLFDENAACHIALGQCYTECFENAASLTKDDVIAKGGNQSIIHIDWMIGSGEIDIDGLDTAGNVTPVMRKGEWAS